jgi:tape measure domain-containing protein
MAVANIDVRVNSRPAVAGLNQVNAASKAATTGVNGLKTAIAPLLSAFAAMQAVKFVFAKTSELETQTKSLEVLTGSVEKATKIIAELTQLGAVTPFTSTELIDAAKRLQAFGVEGDKVVETTRRLADVSGATGAELQGLVTAYGQVQAKGRLQGEELLQFQERGIGLQDELRKMYGMTGQEFQKALSKGRIGAEAVEVAIVRLTEKGGKYANGAIAQSGTLSGKFSTLTDGVEAIAKKIGNVLKPALLEILNLGIAVVDTINRALAGPDYKKANDQLFNTRAQIKKLKGEIATGEAAGIGLTKGIQIQGLETGISPQQGLDAMGGFSLPAASPSVPVLPRMRADLAQLNKQATSLQKRLVELRQVTTPTKPNLKTPDLLGETGGTKKGGGGADKAANEAKRLAAAIAGSKSQLALTKAKFEIEGKMLQAQQDDDKALQIRLTAQGKLAGIRQQIADIRADKEMKAEQKLLEIQNQEILGLGVAREMVFGLAEFQKTEDQRKLDAVKAYLEKQYELNTSVQQQLQLADSVSGILGQGMTSAFDALIQGSEDFGKSLRNIASGALVDIAKQLIRIYIIEQAINSIKSFLTPFSSATPLGAGGGRVGRFGTFGPNYGIKQFAAGGTPPVGRPSLVGERGPELFMPGVRGSIIPNHALGGGTTNVVVNVDASGSSVEGDQQQAKALGNAISAAVQSELVKQKRPGGLLA